MRPRISGRMLLVAVPFLLGSTGCSGGEVQEAESTSTVAATTTRPTTTTTTEATTTTTLTAEGVLEVLVGTLTDPGFEGEAELSLEIRIGGITANATGSSRFQGDSSHVVLEIEGVQREETISVDGVGYERVDDGPWVSDEGVDLLSQGADDTPDLDPMALLKAIAGSEYRGAEVENGTTIHRFEPPAGSAVDPAAFGYAPDSPVEVEGVFFARDDGSPHRLEFFVEDLSDPEGAVSFEFTLVFVEPEGPIVISAPRDVWLSHTSDDFGYTIAYPRGWEVGEYRGDDFFADFFIGLHGDEFDVFRTDLPEPEQVLLNVWVDEFRSLLVSDGFEPGDMNEIEVSEQPGRMLSYTGRDETGAELLGIYVVTQTSESAVFEFILTTGADQTAGEQLIGNFLTTFELTE